MIPRIGCSSASPTPPGARSRKLWQGGRISSRECMQRQVELLRATPEELDDAIAEVRIDPAFPEFLKFCWSRGISAMVVSDGFDRVVHAVLAAPGFPFRSSPTSSSGRAATAGAWAFPIRSPSASSAAPTASARTASGGRRARPSPSATAGPTSACRRAPISSSPRGRSPSFCRSRGLAHRTFTDFHEAKAHLAAWLQSDDCRGGCRSLHAG